ncbi:helix-turn-helix domain-containing protein [Natrialba sp. PRR66]|uniref:helix-turn-helix transcriptional regulator n=1 Tax=Natrialba sp. PRR66 TaxID=3098146 RepID=UPI002B1D17DC|nr:helix-turn-helix domain-containing protein [Natrialba sp. PRR66]
MNDSFEDIQFLARSQTRIHALQLLAEQPRDRDELIDQLDISRATLSRLLRQFEDRKWVSQDGAQYRTTRFGSAMAEDITQLLDTATTIRHFQGIAQYLPFDELGIEFHQLRGARLTEATTSDPAAPARRVGQLLDSADRTRILKQAIDPNASRPHYEAVIQGQQRTAVILTHEAVDTVNESRTTRQWFQEMIANEVPVYRYDGNIPVNLKIIDETVVLSVTDANGLFPVLIETEDDEIFSWAVETFESYGDQATLVDQDAFRLSVD